MITGRITGLRCVTSTKYRFSTRRMFCCKADGSVTWASADSSSASDHAAAGLFEDVAGGLLVDEPAVHDVGAVDELAGLRVDGDDHDDDAVARELPAIAKHLAADVADPQAVDEGHARAHPLPLAHHLADLDHVAVLADQDVVDAGSRPPRPGARDAADAGARRAPG